MGNQPSEQRCAGLAILKKGKKILAPLRSLGPPAIDQVGKVPYQQVQQMLNEGAPWGTRNYWKSGFMAELSDDSIEIILRHARYLPSPLSAVHIWSHHGAVNKVPEIMTAFPNRSFPFNFHILASWQDMGQDDSAIKWTRDFWNDIEKKSGRQGLCQLYERKGDRSGQNGLRA